jgi:serine/threonine protein kinase
MLENIEAGDWPWLGSNWESISEQGKDMVAGLMNPDPNKRLTIKEALSHPWILGHSNLPETDITSVRDELKKFQARKRFRGAFFAVAASNRLRLAAIALKAQSSRDSLDGSQSEEDHTQTEHDEHEAESQEHEPTVHATQSAPSTTDHAHTGTHELHAQIQTQTAHATHATHATHAVSAPASTTTYSYDQLKTGGNWPADIDIKTREVRRCVPVSGTNRALAIPERERVQDSVRRD